MKHVKGWDEEEDDYALFTQSNKKKHKKAFKGHCGYCGEFGHKQQIVPKKATKKGLKRGK